MKRVIVHAGFHKTGTTTIQSFFRVNRAHTHRFLKFPEPKTFRPALNVARSYSSSGGKLLKLLNFHDAFAEALSALEWADEEVLLISAEELSGHLPGRAHVDDYEAAIPLAQAMEAVLREVFEKSALTFYYSLRAPDAWLESAYWHHVQASEMMMGLDEYLQKYSKSAALESIVEDVKDNVKSPVEFAYLEDCRDERFGPAAPLVSLIDFPQKYTDRLESTHLRNARLPLELRRAMLEINRRNLPYERKVEIKEAMRKGSVANFSDMVDFDTNLLLGG